nr:peroxisome biogenesis factor 10-like [Ipomoea batatas]
MWQTQTHKSSFRESLNALEADIQHANSLAGGVAWDLSGHCVQMKVYVDEMPTMSPQERKATLRDFYAVIYPSLKQMEGNLAGDNLSRVVEEGEDDECGICMESGAANMVLPNCAHSMCINCFHHWGREGAKPTSSQFLKCP